MTRTMRALPQSKRHLLLLHVSRQRCMVRVLQRFSVICSNSDDTHRKRTNASGSLQQKRLTIFSLSDLPPAQWLVWPSQTACPKNRFFRLRIHMRQRLTLQHVSEQEM